jgi:hypothetical protein
MAESKTVEAKAEVVDGPGVAKAREPKTIIDMPANDGAIQKDTLPRALYSGALSNFPGAPECHVLDSGKHILSSGGMVSSVTIKQGEPLPNKPASLWQYLDRLPQEYAHLACRTNAVEFLTKDGKRAWGIEAKTASSIWDAYASLHVRGLLRKDQQHMGVNSQRIVSALSKTAITTMIEEASGKLREEQVKAVAAASSEQLAGYQEAIMLARENKTEVLALRADIGRLEGALQLVTIAVQKSASDRFLSKDEIEMVGDVFKATVDKFIEHNPYMKRRAANGWVAKRLFRRLGISACDHDVRREKWTPERMWSAIKFLNEELKDTQTLLDAKSKSLQEGRPVATRERPKVAAVK